jgi:hypothetical protein
MLAPQAVSAVAPTEDRAITRAPSPRPQPRLLPAAGRKGGERMDDDAD